MDPRLERSQAALRAAVFELAKEKSISDVSVVELCQRAGVSRNTFYRRTESPKALLVEFLAAELDNILVSNAHLPLVSGSSASVFDPLARDIFRSVREHASIYRNALGDDLLWSTLTPFVERSLIERLAEHPEIAPPLHGSAPPEIAVKMSIRYVSVGAVAAIETWLLEGDLNDLDLAGDMLLYTAPAWWLGRSAEPV